MTGDGGPRRPPPASCARSAEPSRMRRQLAGSTVGVIGYGQIGRHFCGLLQALAMRVLVADPHVGAVAAGLEHVVLERLLGEADFVVCLAIAVPETENLMNAAAFARMK